MNRRVLYLASAVLSAFCFFTAGIMILSQSGLAYLEKRNHYAQRARSAADTVSGRLSSVLAQAGEYTNAAALAEVFTSQSVSLAKLPEDFRTKVKRVRITDSAGAVLFSTAGTLDQGAVLSREVLSLADGAVNRFMVFTPNQDTFAAITKYDNPLSLQYGQKGYILFELSSAALMRGLGGITPLVRVENGIPLLVLKDTSSSSFNEIASLNVLEPQKGAPLTGFLLNVPYIGNVVYYMGYSFYFPPLLSMAALIFCVLMTGMLFLYVRSRGRGGMYPSEKVQEMKTLISDINKGNSYPKQNAFDALDQGSKFGTLPNASSWGEESAGAPVQRELSTVEASEVAPFVFESLNDSTPAFEDDLEAWEEEMPSAEEMNKENFILDSDEDQILPDDSTLVGEEPEIAPNGFQKEAIEDAFEETFAIDEAEVLSVIPVDGPGVPEAEDSLTRYNAHVDALQDEYGISRKASAENREGLFLIEDEEAFGPSFQIAVEDPIFREVLSKGKVLSLSGSLEESEYLTSLVAADVLDLLSDLFIVPIMDRGHRVSAIVVLGRGKESPPLSIEQQQNLFSYRS